MSSQFFHRLIGAWFFEPHRRYKILRGVKYPEVGKIRVFSSEIAVYLGKDTTWAHSYYGILEIRQPIDPCRFR